MNPDYQHLAVLDFMLKANQSMTDVPSIPKPETRMLRARLVLEEAMELCEALGISIWGKLKFKDLYFLESLTPPNLIKIADACADLKVVTVGTEIACGINGKPVFEEVMRSNMSKFEDGRIDSTGKLIKGPKYSPANIGPILEAQKLATKL